MANLGPKHEKEGLSLPKITGKSSRLRTTDLGAKLTRPVSEFSTRLSQKQNSNTTCKFANNPHTRKHYLRNERRTNTLHQLNEIGDFKRNATCKLKEFNLYRGKVEQLKTESMKKRYQEDINRVRYVNPIAKREWKVQCQVQRDSEAVNRQKQGPMIGEKEVAMKVAHKEKLELNPASMYALQNRQKIQKHMMTMEPPPTPEGYLHDYIGPEILALLDSEPEGVGSEIARKRDSRPCSASSSDIASERTTKACRVGVSTSSNRSSKHDASPPLSVVSHVSNQSDDAAKTNLSTKERISRRAQKAFEASVSRASSKTSQVTPKTSDTTSKSLIDSRHSSSRASVTRSKGSKESVHSVSFTPQPPRKSRPASRLSDNSNVSTHSFKKTISCNSSGQTSKNGVSLSNTKNSSGIPIFPNISQQISRDRDASQFTKPTSSKGSVSLNTNNNISRPALKASTVKSVTGRTSKSYRDSMSRRSSTTRNSVSSSLSTASSHTDSPQKVSKLSSDDHKSGRGLKISARSSVTGSKGSKESVYSVSFTPQPPRKSRPASRLSESSNVSYIRVSSKATASRHSPMSQPRSDVESDKSYKSPSPVVPRKQSSIVEIDEEFDLKMVSLSDLSNSVSSEIFASHSASLKHRISMSDSNESVEEIINLVLSGTRHSTSEISMTSAKEYSPAVSYEVISTEMSTNNAHQSFSSTSGSFLQE